MQNKKIYFIIIVILLVIVLGGIYVLLHTLKPNTTTNNSSETQKNNGPQDTIKLTTYGSLNIFTDAKGITLYHDIQDWPRDTKPPYNPYTKCTGTCSVTWPPFYTKSIKISAPLKIEDFTVFTRPDGKKQVAYRGWPLYYYAEDNKQGDTNGQGVGNIWYVGVSPD